MSGRVAPAPPRMMTKLWYCVIAQRSDIVKEQARSFAVSTKRRPFHAISTSVRKGGTIPRLPNHY